MKIPPLTPKRRQRAVQVACVLALLGLALVVYSVIDPRPLPVIVAMSVAQGIGILSLGIFGIVVLADLRRARILDLPEPPAEAPDEKK